MKFPDDLIVGDILLCSSPDLVDLGIEWKEGDNIAHVEVYVGLGKTWASRNGVGVNCYDFNPNNFRYVRRLKGTFDNDAASKWFQNGVCGMKYGFGDILANVEIGDDGTASTEITKLNGVDCSHFAAALLEVAKCPQFDEIFPKNKITPRDFKISTESVQIWP